MTALAANHPRPSRKLGVKHTIPLNAASVVFQGSIVMFDAEHYGRPAAALASNGGCPGVAVAAATGGAADGDVSVVVQEGEYLFTITTGAQVSQGARVYAEDDNTVDETQGANEPQLGIIAEIVSSTQAWVKIGMTEAIV